MIDRERVRSMFWGIAIGDSLGMPVETFSKEKIADQYDRVTDYLVPDGHKWFNGHKAGTITDDTQLSLAVAEAIIDSHGALDLKPQAEAHVRALREGDAGWGNTTRYAVRNLANGVSPSHSGDLSAKITGLGNGTAMKIAPAALLIQHNSKPQDPDVVPFLADLCAMTHKTTIGLQSGLAQAMAVHYCITTPAQGFNKTAFLDYAIYGCKRAFAFPVEKCDDDLVGRLLHLRDLPEQVDPVADYGGGSCYAYNSIPFTFYYFLQDPWSVDSLYEVVNAGGDTDSNGSMLGALLGALNGMSVWPDHLLDGLDVNVQVQIEETANKICDVLGFLD